MTQRSTLKTASFLLLLASIPPGLQDVQIFHHKAMEAWVGQNVSLPCVVENTQDITVSSFEWTKKEKYFQKLALHLTGHGSNYFSSNVSLKTVYNDKQLIGTYLELLNVDKDHAGTYICSINAFPTGLLQRKTELRLKGKIECDMNSSIVINLGENVTIQCPHDTKVAYTWTKDEVVVSKNSTLHLQSVSENSAGIYTLTVHTGNRPLQQEFNISITTHASASWSDAPTLSSGHNSSSQSEANSFSPLTTFATENVQNATTTASPIFHSPTVNLENLETTSAMTAYEPRERYNESETRQSFSDQSNISSTTQRYNQSENSDLVSEHLNHSVTIHTTQSPMIATSTENDPPLSDGPIDTVDLTATSMRTSSHGTTPDTLNVTVEKDPAHAGGWSHFGWTLVIIVLLISVAVFLYRRRLIKARMDLPPPFKPPPPPPHKYKAVRDPPQGFPRDRCHSLVVQCNKDTYV